MLTPITTPIRRQSFLTYDLEWWPGRWPKERVIPIDYRAMGLRLCGVYDGDDERETYRHYGSMGDFLDGELTHRNRGRVFFAHAGGSHDVQYVLEEIVHRQSGFEVDAAFAGSSAVIVTVRKDRHKWIFCDSFFLLRSKLAKIAESIGMAKGDKENIYTTNYNELIQYNYLDCQILWNAIWRLQETLLDHGGELRPTLASCGMRLIRRRFLKRSIKTNPSFNEKVKPAYCASRVEVFETTCEAANRYDVNSSFPWSMTKPQPGNLLGISKSIPTRENALFIADCDVEVPSSVKLPPLPWRNDRGENKGRIFFPVGSWSAMLDSEDVKLLEECGGRINRVRQVYHFAAFDDLAAYVHEIYDLKSRAKDGSFERELWKLMLNAPYGKFAEHPVKRRVLINPEYTTCQHRPRHEENECIRMLACGIYEIEEVKNLPHAHLPISIHITASSRRLLAQWIMRASRPYYCDTDSVYCSTDDVFPSDPTLLGAMKDEGRIESAEFLGPKLYSYWDPKKEKRYVKSKGFSALSYDQFRDLAEGREVYFERMARIRESMKFGDYTIHEKSIKKRLLGARPKRAILEDGTTRPWHVLELHEPWKRRRGRDEDKKAAE